MTIAINKIKKYKNTLNVWLNGPTCSGSTNGVNLEQDFLFVQTK